MQEHLIIDGNNALHAIPELTKELEQDRNLARESLIRFVEPIQDGESLLTVVFDGRGGKGRIYQHGQNKNYTVIYSSSAQGADGVIERMLLAAKFPERIIVATNDGLIRNCAYEAGAAAMRIEELIKKLDSTIDRTRLKIKHQGNGAKGPLKNSLSFPEFEQKNH
ncbi:MAG: NYN domain-containing protein [Opitutales bacterium]|jgi:predicted RNA-binding protein with PIN domain|tara:strand:- start:607 stop:1101 length:495 start_codon:yes stop_codon:yes gene_type:complete